MATIKVQTSPLEKDMCQSCALERGNGCVIQDAYKNTKIYSSTLSDSDFYTQSRTIRKDNVRDRMIRHTRECFSDINSKHLWIRCHLNPQAKRPIWCKSCFGPRNILPQPDMDFSTQGLGDYLPTFKTEVDVKIPDDLIIKIDNMLNKFNSTVTTVSDDSNNNVREVLTLLKEIKEQGISVNHTLGVKSRNSDGTIKYDADSFQKVIINYLPSILSITITLMSNMSTLSKAVLLVPPFQQLMCNLNYTQIFDLLNTLCEHSHEFITQNILLDNFSKLNHTLFGVLCSLCGFNVKNADIDKVLRRIDLIPKAIKGSMQLIDWIVIIFKEVVKYCCDKMGYENPFSSELEKTLKPYLDTCDELLGVIPNLDTFNSKHVDDLFNCYRKGLKLQEEFARMKVPATHMNILSQRLIALKRKCDALSHLAFISGPRPEPLFLYLWGESGVGKSGAANLINIDIAKIDEDMDPEQWVKNIYLRFPEQEYHDGANNDHLIEYYDDAFQIFDSKTMPDPTALEVIRLGNIVPYPRHMADVADKGFIYAKPRLVMLSSNTESPTLLSLQCPKAFENRINLKFKVVNDPSVVQIDGNPVTLREYNRNKFQKDPNADPLDPSVYQFVGNYRGRTVRLNYLEFISILAYEYRLNLSRTGDTRGFYDAYAKKPFEAVDISFYTQSEVPKIMSLEIDDTLKLELIQQYHKLLQHEEDLSLTEEQIKLYLFNMNKHDIIVPTFYDNYIYSDSTDGFVDVLATSYKIVNMIESGKFPTVFSKILQVYESYMNDYKNNRTWLNRIAGTLSFTGWISSAGLISTIADYLEEHQDERIEFENYIREKGVNLNIPIPEGDNLDFIINEMIKRCKSIFSKYGYSIEKKLLTSGLSKARVIQFGKILTQCNTENINSDMTSWIKKLNNEELSIFMRCIFNPHIKFEEVRSQLNTDFVLTKWDTFKRLLIDNGWGLFDKIYSTHPILGLLFGIVFSYSVAYASVSIISYLFQSFYGSIESQWKSIFSTETIISNGIVKPPMFSSESVVNKTSKPKQFVSESITSKSSKPKGFVSESVVSKTAQPKQFISESVVSKTAQAKKFVTESDSDFVTNGFVDLNTQSLVTSKALGNMRILRTGRENMQMCLNGIIIQGRCFLTYKHAIEHFKELASITGNIEMFNSEGVQMYNISPSEVGYVTHKTSDGFFEDLCMIVLPRAIAPGKNLFKHVIVSDDYPKIIGYESTLVTPQYREGTSHVAYRISNTEIIYNKGYNDEGIMRVCAKLIQTRMETQKGDCGSVLFSMNPRLPRKICGLHVAASASGTSRAIPITQEKLQVMLEECELQSPGCSQFSHEVISERTPVNVFYSQAKLPIEGNFQLEGELDKPASVGSSSSLYESPISGVLQESKVKPAFLRPVLIDGQYRDPMIKSLQKAGTVLPYLDIEIVKECSDDIYQLIWNSDPDRYVRLLTINEAIHGVEDDRYLPSLTVSTSPGYPYSIKKSSGKLGKTTWIKHADSKGPAWIDPELYKEVEILLDNASKGIRSGVLYLDFPKDETRPIAKVDALKTRSVNCSPLPFTIACRVAFGAFCSSQMRGRIQNGSSIGINPYSSEWHDLAIYMKQNGNNIIAGDYGNWDGGLSTELLWGAFDVIDQWYGDDGNSILRRTLFEDIASSTHVCKSFVYSWLHSMPSGTYLTACVNTIINNLIIRLAWKASVPLSMSSMREFNRNVVTSALGDDHLVGVSDMAINYFNQSKVQVYAESLGMTYTDEKKTDRRDILCRPLEEVEFLKRGFHFDDSLARYVGRLSYDSICENFNWLRRGIPTQTALHLNTECAFRELCLYDKDLYNECKNKVIDCYRKNRINLPVIPSWLTNRSQVAIDGKWIFEDL